MLGWLKKTSSDKQQSETEPGAAYGVSAGRYVGEFFILMEQNPETVTFLSLPDMKIREITVAQFKTGVDNKIIEFQEVLPDDVKQACIEQYDTAKKSNN